MFLIFFNQKTFFPFNMQMNSQENTGFTDTQSGTGKSGISTLNDQGVIVK